MHQELETWRWLAILSLAAILTLALATAVGAADAPKKAITPKALPTEIENWARPMPEFKQESKVETADLADQVWRILELHHRQDHEAATLAWNGLAMPPEVVVWKWLALGHAATATGHFEEAEEYLHRAMELRPDNALVYYCRGVLRMQQAYFAHEWPEELGRRDTRLVVHKPPQIVPNTKSMYELGATMDFEAAIELACTFEWDEAIVPPERQTTRALEPTTGDLALALGAEKFEAKAHNTLSYLFLKQGALEVAEQHMDDAVGCGLPQVYGYRDLGDEYRARGQHADAMRAYLKATRFTNHKMNTLWDAIRSFGDAFH
jgi:tetratricopeptide (TPR) repeat protein